MNVSDDDDEVEDEEEEEEDEVGAPQYVPCQSFIHLYW